MQKQLTSMVLATALLLTAGPLLASQDCSERLEQNCTSCHYKSRICEKVGKKTKRAWKNTTKRMIRYGLKLDKSELDEITACLVALEDKSGKFCE